MDHLSTDDDIFFRRKAAAQYLQDKFGFCSAGVLSKYASTGGGPAFQYVGSLPIYRKSQLDAWALGKMSPPVRHTGQRPAPKATDAPTP